MNRRGTLVGLTILLVACGGADDDAGRVPESVLVVDDSAGAVGTEAEPAPDGARIAFSRTVAGRSNIFVADADGSNPVKLTSGVWDHDPVWSPDGRMIAYHAEDPDYDLFVVAADGSAPPRRLTEHEGYDYPGAWLPDGSGIVFLRSNAGFEHMMVAPLDGSPARRLGPDRSGDMHATLSPDGRRLAFDVHQTGGSAIWLVDTANGGAESRQLTTENLENLPAHAWSPDSREIAYVSRRTGTADIWILDASTGESRQLTSDIRDDIQPRWSPNGRWIAFLSDRGGQRDLWLVSSARGSAVRLTNDQAVESPPHWAPDGRSLYFSRQETDTELRLVPVDGGEGRSLLTWKGYDIQRPVRSPDGTTILFTSNRSGNEDIWSLTLGGGEPTTFVASPLPDHSPRYSPDGTQVLFTSALGSESDLWIMPATGGDARNLTNTPGFETETAWSPDGTTIAFASDRDGNDLWIIPAAGGDATRLTRGNLRPTSVEWSLDGRSLFFVGNRTGGGRELYRVPVSGGPPATLGAGRGVGNSKLSPDGSQLSYSSFEGGWAFVDVIPATGGAPRRLTRDTVDVFQPRAHWYPDGLHLLVHQLDLVGNRDALDLVSVRVADAVWQPVTRTLRGSEYSDEFTADGREIITVVITTSVQVRRISLDGVLPNP